MAAPPVRRDLALAFPLLLLASAAALAQGPPAAPPLPPVLPFLADDYGRALAEARARDLPIFVEAWAPWCHTCRAMQAFVLTDRSLSRRAGQFVWLSIDTEKAANAPFLRRYPVDGVPTLFVLDAKSEEAALRWVGGATLPQLEKLLDEGRRAAAGGKESGQAQALARADRLFGAKKYAEAAAAYREVLSQAPPGWKPYARAVEALVFSLRRAGDLGACAATARDAFGRLRETPSAARVAGRGLDCAVSWKGEDPGRPDLVAALAADARGVVARRRPDIAADDISSLYESLARERKSAGDDAGRRQILLDWAAFLEAEAGKAPTPQARAAFDSHRLDVYLDLGQPERAVPMLRTSEKDFPEDYDAPSRLAIAYAAMKEYQKALLESDKALSKSYGPRKILLLTTRSRIHTDEGDPVSARIAMEEAIREAEALPPGQRDEDQVASLRKQLAALPP